MDGPRNYHTEWSRSERERQIPYESPCVWNLKYDTNEPGYKKETVTDTENRTTAQGWEGRIGSWAFSSVAQSDLTLRPADCSTPGFPVHHQLLELAQTHVHRVGDAIQPSHLCHSILFLPSIFPTSASFPMSQLFARDGQSTGVSALASFLPKKSQGWSPRIQDYNIRQDEQGHWSMWF